MFVASFYCYLNCQDEFVIDLDDIWRWLGFSTKQKAKDLLEKAFTIEKEYILPNLPVKQLIHTQGGHNKEIFMLKVATFKKFCLKAGTKKADEIHDYYLKLEETLHEVIQEESNELKLQLEHKDQKIKQQEEDKRKIREKTILEQFPKNTQCVYYGTIDDVSNNNEKLIKYGNSNDLNSRKIKHRQTYNNFRLINAFKVDNKLQIENAIKEHKIFNERQRTICINGQNYVELLNIEGISFTEIDKTIKEIITSVEFTQENFMKLLEENKLLKKELEKYHLLELPENPDMVPVLIKNPHIRNKNGNYIINGIEYDKLVGTREEIFNNLAYKTTGGLTKDELIINPEGKVISKKKSVQEKINNRFINVNRKKKKQ
jgi:hypothetical protein